MKFEQSAILDNESKETVKLLFHPYEPILVAADNRDGISIWNFEDGVKLKRFSNKNRPGTYNGPRMAQRSRAITLAVEQTMV